MNFVANNKAISLLLISIIIFQYFITKIIIDSSAKSKPIHLSIIKEQLTPSNKPITLSKELTENIKLSHSININSHELTYEEAVKLLHVLEQLIIKIGENIYNTENWLRNHEEWTSLRTKQASGIEITSTPYSDSNIVWLILANIAIKHEASPPINHKEVEKYSYIVEPEEYDEGFECAFEEKTLSFDYPKNISTQQKKSIKFLADSFCKGIYSNIFYYIKEFNERASIELKRLNDIKSLMADMLANEVYLSIDVLLYNPNDLPVIIDNGFNISLSTINEGDRSIGYLFKEKISNTKDSPPKNTQDDSPSSIPDKVSEEISSLPVTGISLPIFYYDYVDLQPHTQSIVHLTSSEKASAEIKEIMYSRNKPRSNIVIKGKTVDGDSFSAIDDNF